jgi:hypothetical protein
MSASTAVVAVGRRRFLDELRGILLKHSLTMRAGLKVRDLGAPIDVLWFRLPRRANDPAQALGFIGVGQFMVLIDRADYWQCAYVIPTRLVQRAQVFIHEHLLTAIFSATEPMAPPWPMRLLDKLPILRRIPVWLVGVGFRSEHV